MNWSIHQAKKHLDSLAGCSWLAEQEMASGVRWFRAPVRDTTQSTSPKRPNRAASGGWQLMVEGGRVPAREQPPLGAQPRLTHTSQNTQWRDSCCARAILWQRNPGCLNTSSPSIDAAIAPAPRERQPPRPTRLQRPRRHMTGNEAANEDTGKRRMKGSGSRRSS